MNIGKVIYGFRKCEGLSRSDMATILNVDSKYLMKFERNDNIDYKSSMAANLIKSFCSKFGVPFELLIFLSTDNSATSGPFNGSFRTEFKELLFNFLMKQELLYGEKRTFYGSRELEGSECYISEDVIAKKSGKQESQLSIMKRL